MKTVRHNIVVVSFFVFHISYFIFPAAAQDTARKGEINIYQDKRIENLVTRHIEFNEKNKTIKGYRIQIAADTKRDLVLERKGEFVQHYSQVKTYFIYQQPYFKLRAGDFRTRLDAQKFLQEILPLFSSAFIVKDEISINE